MNLNRYRTLPIDLHRGSPLHQWGTAHAHLLGSYWTVPATVSLQDLRGLRTVVQSHARLASIQAARRTGTYLPPIEIGVFHNGSGWLVDGNHRLAEARRAKLRTVEAIFTFIGT